MKKSIIMQKWESKYLNELQLKRKEAVIGKDTGRIQKQHEAGKLTARERVELLLDKNSFSEIDIFMESQSLNFGIENKKRVGDGVVTGYGLINGRFVFLAAQDFTTMGGTLGEYHAKKICHIMDMAYQMRAPIIFINDSGGARIEEGIDSLSGYSDIFYRNTIYSGIIPQIAIVLGPCAGGACYSPAICDYIIMSRRTSNMFITGPGVVKTVLGEDVSANELGDASVHMNISGVAHFVYEDDNKALKGARELLSYLPQSREEKPAWQKTIKVDKSNELEYIVPDNMRKVYDIRDVLYAFLDKDTFLEVQKDYAPNIVIGYARLDGDVVGIVANQAMYMAGSLDSNASEKAARFIRCCDCYNIPIITLVDVPGFLPGKSQEHGGIIRRGAKLLYAFSEATVPRITLILRKAYGGAYIAMNSKGIGADRVFAWPIAQIAVMGAEGAVDIVFKKEIKNSEVPEEIRNQKIKEYEEQFMNPYLAAQKGYVDEIITPGETRFKLSSTLKMLKTKKKDLPINKHGNIPL